MVASPYARKLAAEAGLSLEGISGSGPEGRIVAEDVHKAVAAGKVRRPCAGCKNLRSPGWPALGWAVGFIWRACYIRPLSGMVLLLAERCGPS